jgi:hypothetical protein
VGTIFSAPVLTGSGSYPASCIMGTWSFPGVESGLGVTLTPHPLPVPWPKIQNTAIPLLSLRAFVACKKYETYLPHESSADSRYGTTCCMSLHVCIVQHVRRYTCLLYNIYVATRVYCTTCCTSLHVCIVHTSCYKPCALIFSMMFSSHCTDLTAGQTTADFRLDPL